MSFKINAITVSWAVSNGPCLVTLLADLVFNFNKNVYTLSVRDIFLWRNFVKEKKKPPQFGLC